MWRINRDESHLSDAELISWEYVLPFKHIPIFEEDKEEAEKLSEFLLKTFSKQVLKKAAIQIKNNTKEINL